MTASRLLPFVALVLTGMTACDDTPASQLRTELGAAGWLWPLRDELLLPRGQHVVLVGEAIGRAAAPIPYPSLVLGASQETRSLRAFRDLYLRRSVAGRWLIGAYYRTSPCLCEWMKDKPKALAGARQLLRMVAWLAAAAVERQVRVP